jgi:hypothetical protein
MQTISSASEKSILNTALFMAKNIKQVSIPDEWIKSILSEGKKLC